MRIKLVLVGPKYQINLGYMARTAMNFGVGRLHVVSPRAKLRGKKARMYSKHAYKLLEDAKVYRSLDDAIRDCALVVGTTGVRQKGNANLKRLYFAEEAVRRMRRLRGNRIVALLIGRDDTGLTSEEVEKCDMLAYIGTNPEYPVMNISHAMAVMLYLMTREELSYAYGGKQAQAAEAYARETEMLLALVKRMVNKRGVRNKKAVLGVFRRMLRNAQPTRKEVHALITALKQA